MMTIVPALAINLMAIVAVMLLLWRYSVSIQDVSFIDAVWAYGMVFLAGLSVVQAGGLAGPHGWALLILTGIWGLRLGTHLLSRWRRLGRDPRYERIVGGTMKQRGWSFSKTALIMVFMMQGPLLWIVSMPAQAGILSDSGAPLQALGIAGIILAVIGIGFETIGDRQLEAFRADPSSHGKVLDTGLWRYTRHPNYFGDACTWWGIWLVAIGAGAGLWTIAGPIFLTFTLVKWSGAALLEKGLRKKRPGYDEYIARTSGFIPWPPKK
jgi:steroid 5-alpha reductase family enzyme